ncbi:hypothetical protein Tco_0821551 [Tanacetum coccineum]|uniref:Uncharacterized protein n=1 Tax=Tanacetum coccineum TaxID=301880 RepID=A0ABQ5AFK3_9ASTR
MCPEYGGEGDKDHGEDMEDEDDIFDDGSECDIFLHQDFDNFRVMVFGWILRGKGKDPECHRECSLALQKIIGFVNPPRSPPKRPILVIPYIGQRCRLGIAALTKLYVEAIGSVWVAVIKGVVCLLFLLFSKGCLVVLFLLSTGVFGCCFAVNWGVWSRLFEVYASELLSQFKGKTANIRCCSCIDDNKEHTELVTNGNVSSRKTRARASTTEFEEEMKQDDEYYEQHVAGGTVAYMEMYLSNSGETYSTIKSLEGVGDLICS